MMTIQTEEFQAQLREKLSGIGERIEGLVHLSDDDMAGEILHENDTFVLLLEDYHRMANECLGSKDPSTQRSLVQSFATDEIPKIPTEYLPSVQLLLSESGSNLDYQEYTDEKNELVSALKELSSWVISTADDKPTVEEEATPEPTPSPVVPETPAPAKTEAVVAGEGAEQTFFQLVDGLDPDVGRQRRETLLAYNRRFILPFVMADVTVPEEMKYNVTTHGARNYNFPTVTVSVFDPFKNLTLSQMGSILREIREDKFPNVTLLILDRVLLTSEPKTFLDGIAVDVPKWELTLMYQ